MNALARNALMIFALLAVVIAGSYFYSRSMRQNEAAPQLAPPETQAGPNVMLGTPVHAELTTALGLLEENRLEQALVSLERVPTNDAGYLLALNHIGSVKMQLDDWEGAREALETLRSIQIDTVDVLSNLAWINLRLEDYEAAELAGLRALEIEPDRARLRYDVALFRVAQHRLPEGLDTYERAVALNADRASVLGGLDGLLTLHELHPEIAGTHYALAYFARRLGREELELDELRHYLATDPTGPTAEFARSRLEEAGGAPD